MRKGIPMLAAIVIILALPLASIFAVSLLGERITPNDQFFKVSIDGTPAIDASSWNLTVEGSVLTPISISYAQVLALPDATVTSELRCVGGPSGTAVWRGVPLRTVLEMAGVGNGTQDVVFHAADGYSSSLNISEASAGNVLLAYEMNGAPLPPDHGFPLRLVVPGNYGYKWVKWITRIELVGYDYKGYWESRGWSDGARITATGDWRVHSSLLSVAYIFCGLSVVSGYRVRTKGGFWHRFPDFMDERFHKVFSWTGTALLVATFIYWAYATFTTRGNLFYTSHGLLAGLLMGIFVAAAIAGMTKVGKGAVHTQLSLFGFVLFTGVIILGLLLA